MPNPFHIFRQSRSWKYILCLTVLCLFSTHEYFVIRKGHAYPWWHSLGNDIDATYAATAVGLLNDSELTLVAHPAATIYTFHGAAYRFLSFVSLPHKKLLHLRNVGSLEDASDILQISTQTSRILSFLTTITFIILLFGVINFFINNVVVTSLFIFYIVTSFSYRYHLLVIRPEIPSLVFFLAALLIFFSHVKRKQVTIMGRGRLFVGVGFLLGLSVFSKIQIGPPLVMFLGGIVFYLLQQRLQQGLQKIPTRQLWICFWTAVGNFVLMPWWALKKPDFVTPQFLHDTRIVDDVRRIYGIGRESFVGPVVIVLFIFGLLSAIFLVLRLTAKRERGLSRVFPIISFFNFFNLGAILSVYIVLLPVSISFAQYIANTKHLVYATLSNVFYGGFLINRVLDFGTLEKIVQMHWNQCSVSTSFLRINVLYFVGLAAVVCGIRLCLRKPENRIPCLLSLCFFGTAFIMDVLATMRHAILFQYYAIYSLCFYSIGMAIWVGFELRNQFPNGINRSVFSGKRIWIRGICLLLPGIFLFFLAMHDIHWGYNLLQKIPSSGISAQNPALEYRNTRSHAAPFWRIVEESIHKK